MISGHAQWEVGGRRYSTGPDTLCHIPAGQTYYLETRANDSVLAYVVRYRSELLSPAFSAQMAALGMLSLDLSTMNINQARVVRSLFQEMLFEQEACQGGWEELLLSRLIELAVRMLRLVRRRGRSDQPAFEACNESAERVARYVLRLKSRFFRQESMEEAARGVGLSRRQFTALFRKVTGQSWHQYLVGLRLKHAGMLLIETDSSVLGVAFESGFEDISHFHRSFKAEYGCSPMEYREQNRVRLPADARPNPGAMHSGASSPGFKFRGMKGWFWTTGQYLEEIAVLSGLRMNFLMNCPGATIVSRPREAYNKWWERMTAESREAYSRIIRACRDKGITFCFALHPQLGSPHPFDPANPYDPEAFYQHFAWAQSQHVQWFSICLAGTGWGPGGPVVRAASHAALVNEALGRLRTKDADAQLVFCPIACWGDGSNPEHRAYLEVLAREMDPEVYVFWNGDSIVTPRVTRIAAESFKSVVKHRLFLWDNYPVNDANPTLHLGPLRGRDPDLCEVIEGYLSNSMCMQNQINRIPLATCADYAYNPQAYDPGRSIGEAILRLGKTSVQQHVLKSLVEAYPGFIVTGGGTGTNPVRAKVGSILAGSDSRSAGQSFIQHIEEISSRLAKEFPGQFRATKKTILDDIDWMKQELGRIE